MFQCVVLVGLLLMVSAQVPRWLVNLGEWQMVSGTLGTVPRQVGVALDSSKIRLGGYGGGTE